MYKVLPMEIQIKRIRKGTQLYEDCLTMPLCPSDQEELLSLSGVVAPDIVKSSIDISEEAYAGIVDGTVHMVFGVNTNAPEFTIPWMLSDGWFQKHYPVLLTAKARYYMHLWLKKYDRPLRNLTTDAGIHWLQVVGFNVLRRFSITHLDGCLGEGVVFGKDNKEE